MVSRALAMAGGALLFAVLATANSGGYRYGISDQAFYVPAVVRAADPEAYPRDRPLIDAQAALMWSDEILAAVSRVTGLDLPAVHFGLYLATMIALGAAAIALARALNGSWWMAATLAVLLTFRHRIARTGANSLEGYAHPRMLAFALGALALACALRARWGWTAMLVAGAAVFHTTTAIWFALLVAATAFFARPDWRRWMVGLGVAGVAAAAVIAVQGSGLAARFVRMDDAWLQALQDKDYLFPTGWPVYAWVLNLAYLPIIVLIHRRRRALGVDAPAERAVIAGLAVLLAFFLVSVPLTAWKLALAVQLQVTRVFWLLDLTTLAYVAWWLSDTPRRHQLQVRAAVLTILLLFSGGRGVYLVAVAQDRDLVQMRVPHGPWLDTMEWLRTQPKGWHVVADPGHAWKYGVAVRLAAERDTLLESGKDTALAMYDRSVAMRVVERASALGDFDRLTASDARALGRRFAADVLVAERRHPIDLPVLYQNERFVVYDLR